MLSHSNKKTNNIKSTSPVYKECPDLKPRPELRIDANSDDVFVFSNDPQTSNAEGSVISDDLTIEGSVKSDGVVQLQGVLIGDMACRSLIVVKGGSIIGNVWADEVIINGHVKGAIYGRNVLFQAGAVVEGDVCHEGISIESGAQYDGYLKRKKYYENELKEMDQTGMPSDVDPARYVQAAE